MKVGAEDLEEAEMTGEAAGQEADLDNENTADHRVVVTAVNEDLMLGQERCTKLPAAIAGKNAKCHLSQQPASQSIVENVSLTIRSFR